MMWIVLLWFYIAGVIVSTKVIQYNRIYKELPETSLLSTIWSAMFFPIMAFVLLFYWER